MNPYAPPKSHVEDTHEAPQISSAPRSVLLATWLLAASLALGLLKMLAVPVPGPLWVGLVFLALMVGLNVAIAKGKNWARITFAVLVIIGLPSIFLVWEQFTQEGILSLAILLAQTVLQVTAALFMFLPASKPWFRRSRYKTSEHAAPRAG